jgi:hypothetical protein
MLLAVPVLSPVKALSKRIIFSDGLVTPELANCDTIGVNGNATVNNKAAAVVENTPMFKFTDNMLFS